MQDTTGSLEVIFASEAIQVSLLHCREPGCFDSLAKTTKMAHASTMKLLAQKSYCHPSESWDPVVKIVS